MRTNIKVLDAMTTKPVVCKIGTTLLEAAKIMKQNGVGSVLVIDDKRGLLGLITERDFVTKAVLKKLSFETTTVSDIMTKSVVKISPEKDIFEAMLYLKEGNHRRMPVVDDEKSLKPKLLGMLTMKDILKIAPALLDIIYENFELREETRKPVGMSGGEFVCSVCGRSVSYEKKRD
ncbi:MAG: CBS domain-containing protein [Candidatus Woesearchaeota archaeon]